MEFFAIGNVRIWGNADVIPQELLVAEEEKGAHEIWTSSSGEKFTIGIVGFPRTNEDYLLSTVRKVLFCRFPPLICSIFRTQKTETKYIASSKSFASKKGCNHVRT